MAEKLDLTKAGFQLTLGIAESRKNAVILLYERYNLPVFPKHRKHG